MNRWHITRIPLHCVDDRPAAGSPTRRGLGPRLPGAVPLFDVIRHLGGKSRRTITARSRAVKARFAVKFGDSSLASRA